MKKNKKKKIIWITIIAVVLLLIGYGIFYLITHDKSYSYAEKKWINDNSNNVIDIYIESDLPIFSSNGVGVFYDFLSALEKDINISFNIVYDKSAPYSMTSVKNDENSIAFYKDHYVVIGKENKNITSLSDLSSMKVGILSKDLNTAPQYLSDYRINYTNYSGLEDLKTAFAGKIIEVAVVPLYSVMNEIIKEEYIVNYHIDGFNAYYGLNLSTNNPELNGIFQKFYDRWNKRSVEKRNEHLVNSFYNIKSFTEIQKNEIINDDYKVGYLNILPFEGIVNNTFTGLTSAYLSGFSDFSGATYKYEDYKSVDELVSALNKGEIDIIANYYGIGATNYTNSDNFITGEYVLLTHANNPITITTLSTLSGNNVMMLSKMNLTNSIKSRKLFTVQEYSTKELFKKMDKNSIIMVEKDFYEYYKNKQFKNYVLKYTNNIKISNTFLLKNDNASFNKLFNFYLKLNSDNEMRSLSTQKLYSDARNNIILSFILKNIIYIVLTLSILAYVFYRLGHKIRLSKRIKKEDKLLYIDVMTNLKNRNYLNDNIDYWSENKVYPQTILIIDLNRIKEINDRFGHEEGDKQIKAAANSLIKTQRENSEIMRTNGNEFMVYLVGYEEKVILSYIHKLTRELNSSLPFKDFGVALGYAMIDSELSTIDDAINDASKRMRENKGVKSEK